MREITVEFIPGLVSRRRLCSKVWKGAPDVRVRNGGDPYELTINFIRPLTMRAGPDAALRILEEMDGYGDSRYLSAYEFFVITRYYRRFLRTINSVILVPGYVYGIADRLGHTKYHGHPWINVYPIDACERVSIGNNVVVATTPRTRVDDESLEYFVKQQSFQSEPISS